MDEVVWRFSDLNANAILSRLKPVQTNTLICPHAVGEAVLRDAPRIGAKRIRASRIRAVATLALGVWATDTRPAACGHPALAWWCPHCSRRMLTRLEIPFMPETYSKRCWFTFPSRTQVEQPIIWQMSRTYPNVMFDIRQASVQNEIGIMAVLLKGKEAEVLSAIEFMRAAGVTVEPIEKSVVEG